MSEPNKNKRTVNKTVKKISTTKKIAVKKSIAKKSKVKKTANKKKSAPAKKISKTAENKAIQKNETIVFDAVLTINEVKALHEKLLNVVTKKKALILDASKIEMIDTATIQLLLSFIASMQKNNIGFKWLNPSVEFLERVSILNLTDAICVSDLNQ